MERKIWKIVGLMSGTSLDGLDIALCEFSLEKTKEVSFRILKSTTIEYTEHEKTRLSLMEASAVQLAETDVWFGGFCGEKVSDFLQKHSLQADLVASHGHTVFHQPSKKFSTQIGQGAALSASAGLPVVCDFRSMDVALGGQGAPLVPIGDQLLFKEFAFCLNLGGIANISVKRGDGIIAYDVCPANIPFNLLARQKGMEYDRNGEMARKGKVDELLLAKMEQLGFYSLPSPKSLGKEWIDEAFLPLLNSSSLTIEDKMATVCEHVSKRIAEEVLQYASMGSSLLVTGGGAFHSYLIEKLEEKLGNRCTVHIPVAQLVNFKEALVFAFLGYLRVNNKVNSLGQVTGARKDSIGGALYGDFSKLFD
jgi:anhydro-N-acetylmuramic acid kinase